MTDEKRQSAPGSSGIWRQPWWWALLLLPITFALSWQWEFRTHVRITVDKEGAHFAANETQLTLPFQSGQFSRVSVRVLEPFEQRGGGSITLTPAGQLGVREEFPKQWKFPNSKRPPGGDWWIDSLKPDRDSAELGRLQGNWSPPFTVDLDYPGRLLRPLIVHFEGNPSFECAIRYGLMNNDVSMYLVEARQQGRAKAMGGAPGLESRHLIAVLAQWVCVGCVLVLGFSAIGLLDRSKAPMRTRLFRSTRYLTVAVVTLVALRFALSWWVADHLFSRLPHFQDDLCYLIRAKWLLAGAVDLPVPEFKEHFQIPFTAFFHGRWLTPYPILWSAMLALGMKLGAHWLVAPACGALAILFQYRLGSRVATPAVGAWAAALLALSPLSIILSGSLLNHSATAMFLGLFAWLFVKGWGEGRELSLGWLAMSGLALGLAFGIRPFTAAVIGLPTFFLGMYEWKRRRFGAAPFFGLAAFAVGVFLGMVPTLVDNALVTGHPLLFAYRYLAAERPLPELLPEGLFWSNRAMGQLPMLVTGWGWPWLRSDWWLALPFGLAAVPFLLGRANRHDWWLLGIFVSVVVGHFIHPYNTMHGYGPRIYSDTFFALLLLVARGSSSLAEIPARLRAGASSGCWTEALSWALFLALCVSTAATLHERLERYRGYNDVDDNTESQIARLGVSRALFLLRPDPMLKWLRVANLIPVDPAKAAYVFATLRDDNDLLINAYGKDRTVYIINDRSIEPYVAIPRPK